MAHSLKTLLVDEKPSDMEVVVLNAIKSAGFGVRPEYAVNRQKFLKKLDAHEPDLILYRAGYDVLPLSEVQDILRSRKLRTPVLAVSSNGEHAPTEWLKQGAHDQVDLSDLEHLQLVVRRTARAHVDYLELQQARTALHAREHLHLNLLESSVEPIAYIHDGMHIHANKAYLDLFGQSIENLEIMPMMDLVPEYEQQHLKVLLGNFQNSHEFTESARIEILLPGGPALAKLNLSPAEYDGENCMQIVVRLLTPTQNLTGQFDYLAIYDVASGLYTRNYLLEQLDSVVDQATDGAQHYALVLLQIDNYDELENRLGYNASHQLYTETATRIKHFVDLDDILCRYKTSSFGLLHSLRPDDNLDELVSSILDGVNETLIELEGRAIPCRLTAGIAMINLDANDAQDILHQANEALTQAKQQGKEYVCYRPSTNSRPRRQVDQEWAERLREALKEDRLKLVYQPIVDIHSEDTAPHYDILLRLEEKNGSYITPADFLSSAERTGLAKGLDRWVLINALKVISEAQREDPRTLFAIKLTEDTLRNEDAILWIRQQIGEHPLMPGNLVFEIKSPALISHLPQAQFLVETLLPLGCRFSVDEFNGVLDPNQIFRYLPVHYLKLDIEYVRSLQPHPRRDQILAELVEKVHAAGKKIVVKNVGNKRDYAMLNELNIDFVQGNFMHPPSDELNYARADLVLSSLFDPRLMAAS